MSAFGPVGGYWTKDGANRVVTCPTGSYMQVMGGNGGAAVDNVTSVTCRNIVTGQTTNPGFQQMGHNGGSARAIACPGSDGLSGFKWSAPDEVRTLTGKCRGTGGGGGYDLTPSSLWGRNAVSDGAQCDSGLVYQIQGGESNRNGYVTQFKWACKNFPGMQGILNDTVARGKCQVGDDGSSECQEIKSSMSVNEDDVKAYCGQSDNVISSQKCAAHYNLDRNNANYRQLMNNPQNNSGYCRQGDNYTTDACKAYCSAMSDDDSIVKSDCDDLYTTKCKDNTSSLCSCLQPWESYPEAARVDLNPWAPKRPDCYNPVCIAQGYKPQRSESCPSCVQSVISTGAVSNLTFDNIVQSCGLTAAPAGTSAPVTTPAPVTSASTTLGPSAYVATSPPTSASSPSSSPSSSSRTLLLLAAAVVVIIIIGIIIALIL